MSKSIGKMFFNVKPNNTAEIMLYDDIGGFFSDVTSKSFAEELAALGDVEEINLRINSGGGSVFDGIAIHNMLKRHTAKVVVDIDGVAASIASIVAMAGDKIRMGSNAFMMIHDPWAMVDGTASELRDMAETLDKIGSTLIDTYTNRTKQDSAIITQMMKKETWMDSEEAKSFGFVDEVTDGLAMAARCDVTRFKNVPNELARIAKLKSPRQPAEIKQIVAKVSHTLRKFQL